METPSSFLPRLASVLLSLAVAAVAVAAPPDKAEILPGELEVERIGAGIWLHTSSAEREPWGRVAANGLVVVGDGEAAVLDTPWTEAQTEALFDWVEANLGARVTAVVPAHSHQDCAGGLAVAHRRGARSYAYEKTAEFARRDGAEVPQNVFADRLEVAVGGRTLTLEHAGPGHTVDTIVVWIPDDRVLFGGCLVRSAASTSLGYTAEADLERWPATIERLLEEYGDARLIVPGHGRPGGREHLEHTLELLRAP